MRKGNGEHMFHLFGNCLRFSSSALYVIHHVWVRGLSSTECEALKLGLKLDQARTLPIISQEFN